MVGKTKKANEISFAMSLKRCVPMVKQQYNGCATKKKGDGSDHGNDPDKPEKMASGCVQMFCDI